MRPFSKTTTIGFIGAGAVGGSLSLALHRAGYPVAAVASRTQASAETFASRILGCTPYRSPQKLVDSVGFVFVTTPDDAIAPVCDSLRWRREQGVAHCSGAASLEPAPKSRQSGRGSRRVSPAPGIYVRRGGRRERSRLHLRNRGSRRALRLP